MLQEMMIKNHKTSPLLRLPCRRNVNKSSRYKKKKESKHRNKRKV
jgi:hypothetical protein